MGILVFAHCLFICVHKGAHMCAGGQTFVYACLWKPEVNFNVSLREVAILFFELGSWSGRSLQMQPVPLAAQPSL